MTGDHLLTVKIFIAIRIGVVGVASPVGLIGITQTVIIKVVTILVVHLSGGANIGGSQIDILAD